MNAIPKKPALGKSIELTDILVSDRMRVLRPETVDEIVASFESIGQLQPIVVRKWQNVHAGMPDYVLVAGAHRLEAARKLKWEVISAVVIDVVDAAIAEIDENLVRADLSPAERKVHIGRRKELYEAAHPETRHGAVGRGGKSSKDEKSFVDDTAAKTGRGRSSISRDVRHAEIVAALGEIPGTSLDSDSEIEALSKLPAQEQRDLVEQAKAGIEVTAKPASRMVTIEASSRTIPLTAPFTRLPDRTIPLKPADNDEEPAPDTSFADQIWQSCTAAWELLRKPDNWPELKSAAAMKRRDKALDEFHHAWTELHDIAKKATPKPAKAAENPIKAAADRAEAKRSAPIDNSVRAAADRAEAKRPALIDKSIKAAADRAEASRAKRWMDQADDYPNLAMQAGPLKRFRCRGLIRDTGLSTQLKTLNRRK